MSSAEYGQLVEFLGRQFADVNRQFADVDRRLAGMDLGFGQMIAELRREMLGHFDAIHLRFDRLEKHHVAELKSRIDDIEQRLGR